MVAIPPLAEEDAKRPNREHESLVGERTRLVNRIKSSLVRLGIRTFKPMLRRAPEHLDALRTPEGAPVPVNTLAELCRDLARLHLHRVELRGAEGDDRSAWPVFGPLHRPGQPLLLHPQGRR